MLLSNRYSYRGNSVVDLSASTKGGAVMLLRSPLMVAMDCVSRRQPIVPEGASC